MIPSEYVKYRPICLETKKLAKAYQGQRYLLRQKYEEAKSEVIKAFYGKILNSHINLLLKEKRPIKSFLWTAEKNGHLVHLFGDMHITLSYDDNEHDKNYFHPTVLTTLQNSEKMYVEVCLVRNRNELLTEGMFDSSCDSSESSSDSSSDYSSDSSSSGEDELDIHQTLSMNSDYWFSILSKTGLLLRLMFIKAGTHKPQRVVEKLADFVSEMEDLKTLKALFLANIKMSDYTKYRDDLLDLFDAIQMGNLESVEAIYKMDDHPSSLFEDRNPNMVEWIIKSLELKEKSLFAPGGYHFIGDQGILALLEKRGVTIKRIPLDDEPFKHRFSLDKTLNSIMKIQ